MLDDGRFYSDDPIDSSLAKVDRLERSDYSDRIVAILDRVQSASESSVFGLIGAWGSGKSSILEIVKSRVKADPKWRVAEFNPWAYSDLTSMLLGFFDEIASALPEESRPGDTKRRIGRLIQRVSPIGKAGGLLGIDGEGAIGAIGSLVAGDGSVSAERKRIEEFLRSVGRPVLVLIDDLDRLSPGELLLVFKLVRFLGRLPKVYYILSYDERTLLDVLGLTELCGGDPARARDYLEKIVQIRFDVPPMEVVASRNLLAEGIVSILDCALPAIQQSVNSRFWPIYEVALRTYLQTPRSINRYLAQLAAFWEPGSEQSMDWVDYCLITFIRTFEPTVYGLLWQNRVFLAVADPIPAISREEGSDYYRFLQEVRRVTSTSELSRLAGIEAVIGQVFLPVSTTHGDRLTGQHIDEVVKRNGAGSLACFDRYFSFKPNVEVPQVSA